MRYCILVLAFAGLISASLFAQKPERPFPFRADTGTTPGSHLTPMSFPRQNPNPDPAIRNDLAVTSAGEMLTIPVLDSTLSRAESEFVPGDPGVFGRVESLQQNLSPRAFTAMALATNITSFPASTAVRLELHFPNYDSQCSGVLIDAKHVLTAGHCVYDTDDDEWAESIGVAPSYDYGPNEFFGTATSYNMISWTGWTQNALWEHDLAVIELDRPVGALAGWCGYGYNTSNAYFTGQTFHNYSYPGDPPYNGELMYYRHGNFDTPQPNILYHNNDSWGGQSGSGAPDEDQIAYSALSHSFVNGSATGHTRIVADKFTHIQEFIAENTPDETDFVAMRADASHGVIAAGDWLDAIYFFLYNNSAEGYTGNIVVDYYLSEDDYVGTSDDILIGTWSVWLDDLEPKGAQWITFDYPTQIPPGTVPGNYYIGAHVTNSDYYGLNNYTDYQDAFPITIECGMPEPPLLNIAGFLTKCEDAVVTLAPSNICADCEVWWSTGDIGPSLSVTEEGGYYAYFLNSCGNFGEISELILITNIPDPETPEIEIDGSTLLCDGDFMTLTVTNPCPDCWIEWSDGQTGETIVVTEEGVYSAFQENICNQSPDSDPVFVETDETPNAPAISANGSTSLCNGQSVTLTASNICSGCIVEWSTGQTGINITVNTPGNYSAILINDCGESISSNVLSVTQGNAPLTPVITASGSTSLCTGQSVTLSVPNLCTGCSVEWSNGQTGNNLQVSAAGTYTAIVTNACGDSPSSNAIAVTLTDAPSTPTISAPSTSLCEGQTMTLTAAGICSGCTIQWSTGQTGSSILISGPGTYSAIASNSCGSSGSSNSITITVGQDFVPVVQVNNTCQLAAPNGNNYQWRLNGDDIPNATTQFWTAIEDGYYSVSMQNAAGCQGISDPVFAEACATSTSGLIDGSVLRFYPNPASDYVFMQWTAGFPLNDVRFELFALDGQAVSQWRHETISGGSIIEIPLPSLATGLYVYRMNSREGQVLGRLMIE